MKLASACATYPSPRDAVSSCFTQLVEAEIGSISWLCLYHTEAYSSREVVDETLKMIGSVPLHGGTSCMGIMSSRGFFSDNGTALGMLAVSDPEGSYGVGIASFNNQPGEAAKTALEAALIDADREGEIPSLVWINAAPGHEEALIRGIEELVGPDVPISGGSTADNEVAGNWHQIAGNEIRQGAVAISVFFPSAKIHYAFHSGFDPTSMKGRVTKAEGRTLFEIDGRPAVQVYNQWTDELIKEELSGGHVLSKTTFAPLGREVGQVGKVPYFKLSHPERVTPDGALVLFTDIAEGDEVVLMTGFRENLVSRAGRVTETAMSEGDFGSYPVIGALVIYCAGCMLAVQDDMERVVQEIGSALDHAPFLGLFTFGEQGCFIGNENTHGNLMISVVAFSSAPQ